MNSTAPAIRFVDMLVLPELREDVTNALRETANGHQPRLPIELGIHNRAGIPRELRCTLFRAADGVADGVTFLFGNDITEEKAEAEQQRVRDKLAAVGMLSAGLAREIRNPLNGAQLHLELLERSLKRSGKQGALETVGVATDEIKRAANLVTEFLDFARPEPLRKEPVSLESLCERVRQLVTDGATSPGMFVAIDMPAQDLVVNADRQRLEQVLLNITQNAIEAIESRNGGNVIIRARRHPRHVWIEIEDDGVGLASSDAPIFDAFYTTKANGTGLGLTIAHRIISDHGGTLQADSRPGHTIFRVTLPLVPQAVGRARMT